MTESGVLQDISNNRRRDDAVAKTFSRRMKPTLVESEEPHPSSEEDVDPMLEVSVAQEQKPLMRRGAKVEGYSRKVPLPLSEQEEASRALHLAEMRAHFSEVDAFPLAVESPVAQPPLAQEATVREGNSNVALDTPAKTASLDKEGEQQTELTDASTTSMSESGPACQGSPTKPSSHLSADSQRAGSSMDQVSGSPQAPHPSIQAKPARPPTFGLSRRSSAIFVASPAKPGRRDSAASHSKASRFGRDSLGIRRHRSSVVGEKGRPSLLSRLSVGMSNALHSLGLTDPSEHDGHSMLGSQAAEEAVFQDDDSRALCAGDNSRHSLLGAQAFTKPYRGVIEHSPIIESPELVAEESSDAAAASSPAQYGSPGSRLAEDLDSKLRISESQDLSEQADISEAAEDQVEQLNSLQQLLKICQQSVDTDKIPSMSDLIEQHASLKAIKKIGEGTFGEAFKAKDMVFKIVPLEGDLIVNGETQKRSEEISAEATISFTLSNLRGSTGEQVANATCGFVEMRGIGVCRGVYAPALQAEWHAWDERVGSENDPVDSFPADQLYVVYAIADGGIDLEKFEPRSFTEARSILLQCTISLAVAEEACEFEHRDMHWGNILVRRQPQQSMRHRLRGVDLEVTTDGLLVTLIDFTLSRLITSDSDIAFSDLNADPDLFKGPKGDCQSETYRRMKKANRADWRSFTPVTNTLWMHYLADILLNRKQRNFDAGEKRELRNFRKRCLASSSCSELVTDELFGGLWQTCSQ